MWKMIGEAKNAVMPLHQGHHVEPRAGIQTMWLVSPSSLNSNEIMARRSGRRWRPSARPHVTRPTTRPQGAAMPQWEAWHADCLGGRGPCPSSARGSKSLHCNAPCRLPGCQLWSELETSHQTSALATRLGTPERMGLQVQMRPHCPVSLPKEAWARPAANQDMLVGAGAASSLNFTIPWPMCPMVLSLGVTPFLML